MGDNQTERPSEAKRPSSPDQTPRELHVHELLGDGQEATIIHAGARYRLRITANNKLILTK